MQRTEGPKKERTVDHDDHNGESSIRNVGDNLLNDLEEPRWYLNVDFNVLRFEIKFFNLIFKQSIPFLEPPVRDQLILRLAVAPLGSSGCYDVVLPGDQVLIEFLLVCDTEYPFEVDDAGI